MRGKKTEKADLERMRGVFLQIGIVIVLLITLIAFEWTSTPKETSAIRVIAGTNLTEEIIPITRQPEFRPPPPVIPKITDVLNIVEDDVKINNELIVNDAEADQQMQVEISDFTGAGEEVVDEEIFFIVEDMPSFQGKGQEGFREWIARNLIYPETAFKNGVSGKVYIQFAVNTKGEVVDAVIIKGIHPDLNKEALRVVMSSPKWEPGKQRGKPVKVQFTFPINFIL